MPGESDGAFRLFANCILVGGARRSIICDLLLRRYQLIPNGLCHILTDMRGLSLTEIKAKFEASEHGIIDDYFQFLVQNEYGFYCKEPDLFPEMDLTWMSPSQITNAIIDIDSEADHPFERILDDLDGLGCQALQLRYFEPVPLSLVRATLELARYGGLRHIDLLLHYSEDLSDEGLTVLCLDNPRVSAVTVHSALNNRVFEIEDTRVKVWFTTSRCESPECCGLVSPKLFRINVEHFTEAQEWNTCLNRKISISADGTIRNCPSTRSSFGNVATTSLAMAVNAPAFRDLWTVAKDQVKVCRDCEFRYICTDCRAYLADDQDLTSKPLKCAYDPYTAQWEGKEPLSGT